MPAEAFKTKRIAARVRPSDQTLIEEAARQLGVSVSDFLASSAGERAGEVIRRWDQIVLSRRDQEALSSALTNPPAPGAVQKAAVALSNSSVER